MDITKHYTGKKYYRDVECESSAPLSRKKCKTYLELYQKCLISENEIIKCEILHNILEKCMNKIK